MSGTNNPLVNYLELKKDIKKRKLFWCASKGKARLILPAVCKWHRDCHDEDCIGCDRYVFKKDKKTKQENMRLF